MTQVRQANRLLEVTGQRTSPAPASPEGFEDRSSGGMSRQALMAQTISTDGMTPSSITRAAPCWLFGGMIASSTVVARDGSGLPGPQARDWSDADHR